MVDVIDPLARRGVAHRSHVTQHLRMHAHARYGILRGVHSDIAGFEMPAHADVERAAAALRLIADPTRIKILWALAQGESNVGCLADLTGASQSAVSQHLSRLRLSGLVAARRDRQFVYYTVVDERTCALLADALGQPRPAPAAPTTARS